jgi:dihydrofolate reductase
MRTVFPTKELRDEAVERYHAIEGGQQTLSNNAGLIDEFSIALSPVLFGSGIRLFAGVDAGRVALEPVRAEPTHWLTHLTYAVRER